MTNQCPMTNARSDASHAVASGLKARHSPAWGEAPGHRPSNEASPVGARGCVGFTRSELIYMLATIALLCVLAMSGLRSARVKAMVGKCMSQQKSTFMGLHSYATAHDGKFPTSVPVENLRTAQGPADAVLVLYFRAAAKEIDFPGSLWCPGEAERKFSTNWVTLSRSNISFFLSLDAQRDSPEMILMGDRHFEPQPSRSGTRLELTRASQVRWGRAPHDGIGHVTLADGSVQRSSTDLAKFVTPSLARTPTNRLEFP